MTTRYFAALLLSLLAGCGSRDLATRNEIYQLAFANARLQDQLQVCDPDAPSTKQHADAWAANFAAAVGWIDITAQGIAAREAAARSEPIPVPEGGCPLVREELRKSMAEASRWSTRIAGHELCGWMSCD
ncbi:MAG: hypothetical protein ABI794_11730 [Betaproteobacteria bacterium]